MDAAKGITRYNFRKKLDEFIEHLLQLPQEDRKRSIHTIFSQFGLISKIQPSFFHLPRLPRPWFGSRP
jgi:hypothetical protein